MATKYRNRLNLDFISNDNTTLTSPDKPPSCVSIFLLETVDANTDCSPALVSGEKSKYVLRRPTEVSIEPAVAVLARIQSLATSNQDSYVSILTSIPEACSDNRL